MWTLKQLYLASSSRWRSAWKTWLTSSNNSVVTFNVRPAANSTHRVITTLVRTWSVDVFCNGARPTVSLEFVSSAKDAWDQLREQSIKPLQRPKKFIRSCGVHC